MRQILRHNQDPDLSHLLSSVSQLRERQRMLISWLGPEAREHFHVLGWEKETLLLGASSGAWKQWLRLHEEKLLRKWNRRYPAEQAKRVQCRVQPTLAEIHNRSRRMEAKAVPGQPLGAAALRDMARKVPDKGLAAAMRRLARTLEKS